MKWAAGIVAIAWLCAAGPAAAEPSSWARARTPEAEARRGLVRAAESLQLKYHHYLADNRARPMTREEAQNLVNSYLRPAAELLELAGAARSPDLFLRLDLAEAYGLLGKHKQAIAVLESIVRAQPPAPLRARAWAALAISFGHTGRVEEEIHAYGEAIAVTPLASERARMYANRAEAYMLLGDITAAVEGYRAAIPLLSARDMIFGAGPTTLWGLAVALDRSGDLDGAIESVRLARTYDPKDAQINGPGWFYVPEYDQHWYEALGHWAVARKGDMGSVRADAYTRAVASIEAFVAKAAPDDKWLPLARVRLKQCEKERAEFLRKEATQRAADAKKGRPAPADTKPREERTKAPAKPAPADDD
jgi:tetratricopeptide (TPR) repeat protein